MSGCFGNCAKTVESDLAKMKLTPQELAALKEIVSREAKILFPHSFGAAAGAAAAAPAAAPAAPASQ
jgi:hypothetical protein